MLKNGILVGLAVLFCAFSMHEVAGATQNAGSPDGIWNRLESRSQARRPAPSDAPGNEGFLTFRLNRPELAQALRKAPKEFSKAARSTPLELYLPTPEGAYALFRISRSPIMAPELAARYPEIQTFSGVRVDNPGFVARLDLTPAGFHAQIFAPHDAIYIDPLASNEEDLAICYYKKDYLRDMGSFTCLVESTSSERAARSAARTAVSSGQQLNTYRLAVACTGEYGAYHGGTKPLALAAIVTTINRVTGIFENDLAIRLELVASNDAIVYVDGATDPFLGNNTATILIDESQTEIDAKIGSANYDIGHTFSTGAGGLAEIGVVCFDPRKAMGVTGQTDPVGDAYDVDYVAHEMGHQFNASHTFNMTDLQREPSTAYEPGSGSTIMAYAGVFGATNDLQSNSDSYFHSASIDQIREFVTSGNGKDCLTTASTGNTPPTVSAGASYTIPAGTPFVLTASGSDPDGDTVTYCWEERDLGPSAALSVPDDESIPLFRSWSPSTDPSRVFPRLSDLVDNTTAKGERLPSTSRVMVFRVTARDNRSGGGGINSDEMSLTVNSASGPFLVTSPNDASPLTGDITVTWSVAGTSGAPVSAANVKISLSTDGGLSYPTTLAASTPNDGSQLVNLPNSIDSTTCRVKIQAIGNIFFDISDVDFRVFNSSTDPTVTVASLTTDQATPTISGTVTDSGGFGLDKIEVVVDGHTYQASIFGDTVWSADITNPLSENVYNVAATVTDFLTHTGVDATTDELTVDLTDPTVTVNSLISDSATPTISGTISDSGSAIQSFTVHVNGSDYPANVVGGNWTASIGAPLADGVYSVLATATDSAGRTGTDGSANELTVDLIDPVVTVNTKLSLVAMPQLSGSVTENGAGLQSITITVNGINYPGTVVGGNWTTNVASSLPDGPYEVLATVADKAGRIGTDSSSNELTVDTNPPLVSVDLMATSQTMPLLTGTVTDAGSGVVSVEVSVSGTTQTYAATINGDAWSASVTSALCEQTYSIVAAATDLAGLTSNDPTASELTIDSTAPLASVDILTTADTTPEITGTASDSGGSGIRSVQVLVNGILYTAMLNGGGAWSAAITEELTNKTTYDVQARVIDKAGNQSLDLTSDELIIDDTIPKGPAAVKSRHWTLYE